MMNFRMKLPKLTHKSREKRVLLLTRNHEISFIIKLTLRKYGFDVFTAQENKNIHDLMDEEFCLVLYDKDSSDIDEKSMNKYKETHSKVEFISMNWNSFLQKSDSYDREKIPKYKVIELLEKPSFSQDKRNVIEINVNESD